MMCCSLFAMAEDRNAYVSNIEHHESYTVVTISAKESALKNYPNGFVVTVRPANKILSLVLSTSRSAQSVTLTKDNPTARVYFYCDSEKISERKACSTNDFVIQSKL